MVERGADGGGDRHTYSNSNRLGHGCGNWRMEAGAIALSIAIYTPPLQNPTLRLHRTPQLKRRFRWNKHMPTRNGLERKREGSCLGHSVLVIKLNRRRGKGAIAILN
ncbi:MAG: hypothetical protein OHK0037_21440 [Elainellaceae cyanobacterium]